VEQQALGPDVQRRNYELNEIAKSISQLAELFKDLSALVIDQGTLLDSVEYNIEQTAVHVQEAVKELNVATRCVRPLCDRAGSPRSSAGVLIMRPSRHPQISEEHRPAEMHLPTVARHNRPRHSTHI
jgi:hypothetical protein